MDAKLIEDARAWVTERERMSRIMKRGDIPPFSDEPLWSDAEARTIVRRLAEQPLEGDDL